MTKSIRKSTNRFFDCVDAILVELETSDVVRGLASLKSLKRQLAEAKKYQDKILEITQTDNIGNALKRIGARSSGTSVPTGLPDSLRKIPECWFKGRPTLNGIAGFEPLTFYQAERRYRRLQPFLEDVWEISSRFDAESVVITREDILYHYEVYSPEEMTRHCYLYIHEYDVEDITYRQPTKTKELPTTSEMMSSLAGLQIDYGVTSREQFIEEQK